MIKKYSIKKRGAGIKALPINFKGKFLGFAFSILNQFDIYGKVAAEFYATAADQFLFALDGSTGKADQAIKTLYGKAVGSSGNYISDKDSKLLLKKITAFIKQVNGEVKSYNSKNNIPAKEIIHKVVKQKKSIPAMAHRKKTARKKSVKRKTVHTIPGKVKAYKRKSTVKAHTRLVAGLEGIGSLNKKPFTLKILRKIFPKTELGFREKSILNSPGAKLTWYQPGVYRVMNGAGSMYMLFTFNHPNYKNFKVVG